MPATSITWQVTHIVPVSGKPGEWKRITDFFNSWNGSNGYYHRFRRNGVRFTAEEMHGMVLDGKVIEVARPVPIIQCKQSVWIGPDGKHYVADTVGHVQKKELLLVPGPRIAMDTSKEGEDYFHDEFDEDESNSEESDPY